MTFLVATTSLPAVDRPNADRWNAARSRQFSEVNKVAKSCLMESGLIAQSIKKGDEELWSIEKEKIVKEINDGIQ